MNVQHHWEQLQLSMWDLEERMRGEQDAVSRARLCDRWHMVMMALSELEAEHGPMKMRRASNTTGQDARRDAA